MSRAEAEIKFGKKPTRYTFVMNPHEDYRASRYLTCHKNTFSRKFVFVIFVNGDTGVAQGLTCKYCAKCELIVVPQGRLETELFRAFTRIDPSKIGQEYVVVGTIDKTIWKKGLGKSANLETIRNHIADFKTVLKLEYSPGGWRREE